MDNQLSTLIQQALERLLTEIWVRGLFPLGASSIDIFSGMLKLNLDYLYISTLLLQRFTLNLAMVCIKSNAEWARFAKQASEVGPTEENVRAVVEAIVKENVSSILICVLKRMLKKNCPDLFYRDAVVFLLIGE